jgi:predicted transcriptional regulator
VADSPEAIARWAERKATKAQPAYRRLTNADRAYILSLDAQGVTQVEIAKRLGCSQPTVSEWLSQCKDSRAEATRYLRGKALAMARKVVNKGQPKDLVRTLEGIEVLQANQQDKGISISINGVMLAGMGQPRGEVVEALSPPQLTTGSESEQNP